MKFTVSGISRHNEKEGRITLMGPRMSFVHLYVPIADLNQYHIDDEWSMEPSYSDTLGTCEGIGGKNPHLKCPDCLRWKPLPGSRIDRGIEVAEQAVDRVGEL